MAIQTINLGVAPSGAGGDTFRSTGAKINENFTNNAHAASRQVGTALGNVMEVGAFGVGVGEAMNFAGASTSTQGKMTSNFLNGVIYRFTESEDIVALTMANSGLWSAQIGMHPSTSQLLFRQTLSAGSFSNWHSVFSTKNAAIDSNGFIKAASPIVQLYADNLELNEEAKQQDITFEKSDVGDYLIKDSSGFAQEGWYIETPKDANGNVLFSVIYETLENGDISIKTYKKKFDLETVSIVADLDSPVDIPNGRWIDLRLQELPKPEVIDEPEQ